MMAQFRIRITKEIYASYEITTDIDDAEVAQQMEEENLRSSKYEESLKLDWDFGTFSPEVIEFDDLSSDEEDKPSDPAPDDGEGE
jgi:hypothetical protein